MKSHTRKICGNKAFLVNIPKDIAKELNIYQGQPVNWVVISNNSLKLELVMGGKNDKEKV